MAIYFVCKLSWKYSENIFQNDIFLGTSDVINSSSMICEKKAWWTEWAWFSDSPINIRMLVTFGIYFKQHFDTRYLVFYNPSPPRMFLSLDLLSEYRIQHGAMGPLYVPSSYSTWISCGGVSGFATDCPCDIWCRGLTTCLLHVGPPFGNWFLNNSWAVGWTWIVYLLFFCILTYAMSWYIMKFLALSLLLKCSLFFKYSCTNILHRHSLCTFYSSIMKGMEFVTCYISF